jgi:membrane protease YdiL (CAAX protease family)
MFTIWESIKDAFIINQYYFSLLVVILTGGGFLVYHYLSEYIRNYISLKYQDESKASYLGVISQRIIGFLAFGLFPLFIFSALICKPIWYYGINLHNFNESLLWTGILGFIVVTVNFFHAGKESNLKHYPQIRIAAWNSKTITINSITWVIYLLGYEFMFRGILLFGLFHDFGASFAITVNTVLYALVHLPKGRKETLGSIPLGIILCIISLETGSFLTAFLFHSIMALSNDFFAIRQNARMKIKTR